MQLITDGFTGWGMGVVCGKEAVLKGLWVAVNGRKSNKEFWCKRAVNPFWGSLSSASIILFFFSRNEFSSLLFLLLRRRRLQKTQVMCAITIQSDSNSSSSSSHSLIVTALLPFYPEGSRFLLLLLLLLLLPLLLPAFIDLMPPLKFQSIFFGGTAPLRNLFLSILFPPWLWWETGTAMWDVCGHSHTLTHTHTWEGIVKMYSTERERGKERKGKEWGQNLWPVLLFPSLANSQFGTMCQIHVVC